MRSFISSSLEIILQIVFVLMLLAGLFSGYQTGGFFGAILGLISSFVFGVVLLGAVFVLLDIRDNTRRAADAAERNG